MSRETLRPTTLILALGVLAAVVLLLQQGVDLDYWKSRLGLTARGTVGRPLQQTPSTGASAPGADSAAESVAPGPAKDSTGRGRTGQTNGGNAQSAQGNDGAGDEVRLLNSRGVELVVAGDYWQGVYLFEQAIQQAPEQILPLINMAVTLTEMGLNRPAQRYLAMARRLNPDHPWLRRNFDRFAVEVVSAPVSRRVVQNPAIPSGVPVAPNAGEGAGRIGAGKSNPLWDDSIRMLWGVDGRSLD